MFIQTDERGTSSFIIYKDNFKYTEKTEKTSFNVWGKYSKTDTSLLFEFQDKTKLPYNFLQNKVRINQQNNEAKKMKIQVINNTQLVPVSFAFIAVKDQENNLIEVVECDKNGVAYIYKSSFIHKLEIDYLGYFPFEIDYEKYNTFDITLLCEEMNMGGRMSQGCFPSFQDLILEYKTNQSSLYTTLMRNDVIFQKIQK